MLSAKMQWKNMPSVDGFIICGFEIERLYLGLFIAPLAWFRGREIAVTEPY